VYACVCVCVCVCTEADALFAGGADQIGRVDELGGSHHLHPLVRRDVQNDRASVDRGDVGCAELW
jgi:hypothetical protein